MKRFSIIVSVVAFLAITGTAIASFQYLMLPYRTAIGYLLRAETAQSPEPLIYYVNQAKKLLPESGNANLLFPVATTDYQLIQLHLDSIIAKAAETNSLEVGSEEYISRMYDMHYSIEGLQRDMLKACFGLC
jgi:hypothetical protein